MKKHKDFEDDGRTIADMSSLDASRRFGFSQASPNKREEEEKERPAWEDVPMPWSERLHYMGAALGASLLIALAFLGGMALIIWLITLYA